MYVSGISNIAYMLDIFFALRTDITEDKRWYFFSVLAVLFADFRPYGFATGFDLSNFSRLFS